MGQTSSSVIVIHSTDIRSDRDSLCTIFPDRFQKDSNNNNSNDETSQNGDNTKTLLLEDPSVTADTMTILLTTCRTAKGTYAVLVLEDAILQDALSRAQQDADGNCASVQQVDTHCTYQGGTAARLHMKGGSFLLLVSPLVWQDPSARQHIMQQWMKPTEEERVNDAREFVEQNRSPWQLNRKLTNNSTNDKLLKSVPVPTLLEDLNGVPTLSPSSQLFPTLQTRALSFDGRYKDFPLNSTTAIPVESELFSGSILFTMRPEKPESDPYWNERIFSTKKRRVVLQAQGKLKRKPTGTLYAGLQISDPMNLGLLASGLCNILLKLLGKFNSNMHFSFGSSDELPHIVFPASTFFERLIVTRPGDIPPEMGSEWEESINSVKDRKAFKTKIDWNTEDTYSMSFYSMYMDFPSWSVVNLPIGKDLPLKTFWGDSTASIVFYEMDEREHGKRHLTKGLNCFMGIQMKYLGTRGQGTIAIDDQTTQSGRSDDAFDDVDLQSTPIDSGLGCLSPINIDETEEDIQFFDAAECHGEDLEGVLTGTYPQPSRRLGRFETLRSIDRACPCVIDLCSKKGKYTLMFVFQPNRTDARPVLRSFEVAVQFLGDKRQEKIDRQFSPRLSTVEKHRRRFGARYEKQCSRQSPSSTLVEFETPIRELDDTFLNRSEPPRRTSCSILSGYLARAVNDRRWIEQHCVLTDKELLFFHPDKSNADFCISLSSVVSVESMPEEQRPPMKTFGFLCVQTFGRSNYLMFRSENESLRWQQAMSGVVSSPSSIAGNSTSFTNHLMETDEPTAEFLHKSSMWDLQKRKLLNCRRYSFKARPTSHGRAQDLVQDALTKVLSLQPKGPNDRDLVDFLDAAAALKDADVYELDDTERTAFFLNIYHIMVMHAFLVLGPPDSALRWASYFNNISYQVSDDVFSLAELEHNIIRAKMSFPSQFFSRFVLPKSKFVFALQRHDFRLNFALNCGSLSYPSSDVSVYKPERLDEQLNRTSQMFVGWTTTVKPKGAKDITIALPRVVQWFSGDFGDGSSSDIMKLVGPFLDEEKGRVLETVWNDRKGSYDLGLFNVKYLPYSFDCRFLTLAET